MSFSKLLSVYNDARSSVPRYRIKFENDCKVDIIYISFSDDSIAILISLFVLINRYSVEELNRFKLSLERLVCESKKKNYEQFDSIQSTCQLCIHQSSDETLKPQEFREKQTNCLPWQEGPR